MVEMTRSGTGDQVRPLRVLQSFAGLGRGGAEQLVMNWYRSLDPSRVQFDFVAEERDIPYAHEAEIRERGGRVYLIPRYRVNNLPTYSRAWHDLLVRHPEWTIVHAHHTTPAPLYLSIARSLKRTCIAHSHNTDQQLSVKALGRRILGRPLNLIANQRLACGTDAGRAMFGSGRYEVVPNSIDVNEFEFRSGVRDEIREDLGISDRLVIGHVGRFVEAKNHRHVVRVFRALLQRSASVQLLLVGEGPLRAEIERDIIESGISDQVMFLGARDDVNHLMCAMDVFLLPSLYEGLPVTLVEAQASGLPSVISDTITDEVRLTPGIRSLGLTASPDEWARAILESGVPSTQRAEHSGFLRGSEYDVSRSVERIMTLYEALARRH